MNCYTALFTLLFSLVGEVAVGSQETQPSPPLTAATQPEAADAEPALALASAERVYLEAELGPMARTGSGRGFPSIERARQGLEKAIANWGRFTVVDDPARADLILRIVEGSRTSGVRVGVLTEKLLVLRGGSDATDLAPLWQSSSHDGGIRDYRPVARSVDEFRAAVEEFDKKVPKELIAQKRAATKLNAPSAGCGAAQPDPLDCLSHGNTALYLPEDREENRGAVKLSQVLLHASILEANEHISTTDLSNYVMSIQKLLHRQLSQTPPQPGKDISMVATLQPDGKDDFDLASRPLLDQELMQSFYDGLLSLPRPAVKGSPVEFKVVFLLWGGSEESKTGR